MSNECEIIGRVNDISLVRLELFNPFLKVGCVDEIFSDAGLKLAIDIQSVRLDRDTTGVILLARNPRIVTEIHQQMSTGQARKTYLALVNDTRLRGSTPEPRPTTGRITTPLIIDPRGHVSIGSPETEGNQMGASKIKPASTTWEILTSSVSHQFSLVQLGLETGYKHQLRVHLAQALGCPILGDTKYGSDAISGGVPISLALHCRTISLLRYKKEGPKKRFELSISAALPSNFAETFGWAALLL
ncbi:hypothetical protein FS837_004527 [Tulasnella sp. UAMH 9824]|nr:hypothetical protein FS837_004527 [Tulasnella sp. UAMH 9824]